MSPPSVSKPTRSPAEDGALRELVRRALSEDRADEDITTRGTVPTESFGRAHLVAREPCIVAGLEAFRAVMLEVGSNLGIELRVADGDAVAAGTRVATVEGSLRSILTAERTALNFVQHLSGVATLTRAFVDAAGGVEVRDTRKTTPGLRGLEKAAVRAGGGVNHRHDLASAVLIKDNHIAAAGGIAAAVQGARRMTSDASVEVECDTLDEVREAVEAGVDEVLLDNMDVRTMRRAVELARGRCRTEASGGITLEGVADVAKCGVDAISVGALTHSARAIDLALEVEAA